MLDQQTWVFPTHQLDVDELGGYINKWVNDTERREISPKEKRSIGGNFFILQFPKGLPIFILPFNRLFFI